MMMVADGKSVLTRLEASEVGICLYAVSWGSAEVLSSWCQNEGRQECHKKGDNEPDMRLEVPGILERDPGISSGLQESTGRNPS